MPSNPSRNHAPNGARSVRPHQDPPTGGLSRRFRRGLGRRSAVAVTGLPLLLVGTLSVPGTAAAKTTGAGAQTSSPAASHRGGGAVADLTAFDNRPRPFGGDWAAGATTPASFTPVPVPPPAPAPAPAPRPAPAPATTSSVQVVSAQGRYLGTFVVTCYDLQGRTASGASTSMETVAVDPRVIPMGSHLFIAGVGERIAQDTGGAIKGNRLDIWEPTYTQCADWGVQSRQVWLG